jgi:L-tartrate/succinate antiporter
VRRAAIVKAAAPVAAGLIIAIIPAPTGLTQAAWYYFALFAAVIAALMLEPIPGAAVGLVGIALAAGLNLVDPTPDGSVRWALAGFANGTVWLVFAAFVFSLGYEKTGLGKRIALGLVKRLGRHTLGLGYAVTLADLALAPLTPSNTARSAGTVFPIIQHIPPLYDSHPGESARRIGSYLMWTGFAATAVTSSMFVTALSPNLLALQLVKQTAGLDISMTSWFAGFWPMGVCLLCLGPYVIYKVYPPQIKSSGDVPAWADRELTLMGPVSRGELLMATMVLGAVALWMFGKDAIDATTVALLAISSMLLTGLVSWDDIVSYKSAWSVWALLATLVTLADGLNRVGFIGWFAAGAAARLTGFAPSVVMAGLVMTFFFVHYMFASITAHTTAVLPVVLAAGLAVPGVPPRTFALLLCYSLGLMGILTPYATGPAPVYFGSGYIPRRDFWVLGLFFGMLFVAVLLGIGVPYLQMMGP